MRDITIKITHREMYEAVRDDSRIMEIDRAIDDLKGEQGFCLKIFGALSETTDEEIKALEAERDARIETIFRARLNRLDREQLISLVMTGEYPVHVRSLEESGISRVERHDIELYPSRTEATVEKVNRKKSRLRKPSTAVVSHPDGTVGPAQVEVPECHPVAKAPRKPVRFRRPSRKQESHDEG